MSSPAATTASHFNISDAPFEWLTSFRSLQHLVLPSRIVNGSDVEETGSCTAELPPVKLNALHVGCGTSTAGEGLLRMWERKRNQTLRYGHVINVDNDERALQSMQRRWRNGKAQHEQAGMGTMIWRCLDFKSDESCRSALNGVYRQLMQKDVMAEDGILQRSENGSSLTEEPGGCVDLVLDKSTLDCLLCSETVVVAQFLCEVYRALRSPDPFSKNDTTINSMGGIYILVTFHPPDFIGRLLSQLPGADWQVEHEIIEREMEDISDNGEAGVEGLAQNCHGQTGGTNKNTSYQPTSAWSSGVFRPDENYRKTVNVFTCRRSCTLPPKDETLPLPSYILNRAQVRLHVERTCNEWYQETNPMVTTEREEQLRRAFLEATAAKVSVKNCDRSRDIPTTEGLLDLKGCYDILFTDAEKEHLSYEYFIEDWDAYCERKGSGSPIEEKGMTVDVALDFLKEMQ
ncbi:hypothetical protein ACHAWF_001896 [Thalassiosira exigua]